jgi:ribosomal protein S18 acetylase RimI-like enzyme
MALRISLRSVEPGDQDFLFKLYACIREPEIAALGWNAQQREDFLRMQFMAQQRWYESTYAGAEHQIVLSDGEQAGRLLICSNGEAAVLVDISLMPEYRNRGIGGELIRAMLKQCDEKRTPAKLQVLKTNPARRLYERLGFRETSVDDMYVQMQRPPL